MASGFETVDHDRLGVFVDRLVTRPPLRDVAGKLPWGDPAFSARMLREHLDQAHDHASRRAPTIGAHVAWIFDELLAGRPGHVLDLGCGPGLYTERLARLGCRCRGVDIGPASIAHARATASAHGLDCSYVLDDVRSADLGDGHDLAMLLFGELNTFSRNDAASLLRRVEGCVRPGGALLLEAHTFGSVVVEGTTEPSWYTAGRGLFSDHPHLVLIEHAWDAAHASASTRLHVADDTGAVTQYAEALRAYTDDDYVDLVTAAGFEGAALIGDGPAFTDPSMIVITARRPA